MRRGRVCEVGASVWRFFSREDGETKRNKTKLRSEQVVALRFVLAPPPTTLPQQRAARTASSRSTSHVQVRSLAGGCSLDVTRYEYVLTSSPQLHRSTSPVCPWGIRFVWGGLWRSFIHQSQNPPLPVEEPCLGSHALQPRGTHGHFTEKNPRGRRHGVWAFRPVLLLARPHPHRSSSGMLRLRHEFAVHSSSAYLRREFAVHSSSAYNEDTPSSAGG